MKDLVYTLKHNGASEVIDDIVEAHCFVVITSELILMSMYVAESINQLQLMAGHFGHIGLHQLCTKLVIDI